MLRVNFLVEILAQLVFISAWGASSDYCADFLKQAKFTPSLSQMTKDLRFDQDKGIVIDEKLLRASSLTFYRSESALRLETNPERVGPYYGLKDGLQINDLGGDPREFEADEDQLEFYKTNFMDKPAHGPAPVLHLYKYRFGFRSGICVPLSVGIVGADGPKAIFDLNKCTGSSQRDEGCLRYPVLRAMMRDPRLKASREMTEPHHQSTDR